MSLLTVMTAIQSLAMPADIPAAQVEVWEPERWDTYPHVVITQDPNQPTEEVYRGLHKRGETHSVEVTIYQQPALANGRQAAQAQIAAWLEEIKAALRANPQLTSGGVQQCLLAGQAADGKGTRTHVQLALDTASGELVVMGTLCIPVQDLLTNS